MAVEIERKFLVNGEAWKSSSALLIRQGYLNRDPLRTVRVRVAGEDAWMTIKGLTTGATRAEFEYTIPRADADALLELCEKPILEKNRHHVQHEGRTWEVDEFLGDNAGLVIAEVELEREDDIVNLPPWVKCEVTHDPRYYNSNLSITPFKTWSR